MLKKKSKIIASVSLFIFILCMAEVIHSSLLIEDSLINESSLIEEEIIESPIEEEKKPLKKEEETSVIDYQPVKIII